MSDPSPNRFDRTNAILAAIVFLVSFVVYALTVQKSFSFWDCGEFIACSYTLGIPHPPGTPLFVLLGRIIALVPFVEDVSHRINYLSVIGSAFTALFSYLLIVRIVGYFFGDNKHQLLNRVIAYIGGLTGAFFVAFSRTNWANSVEAEVYGIALALSACLVWLTLRFFEQRGTMASGKTLVLIFYLAMLGIGIHMTVFLVVPVISIFFLLNKNAEPRDWALVGLFFAVELAMILIFADGRGGPAMFKFMTAVLGILLAVILYRKINWAILIAVASMSAVMMSFSLYWKATIGALILLSILGYLSEQHNWRFQWKTGLAIVLVAFIGMSVHLYIPIRSIHNPRIDENNPSRDWNTFINFLDRKQYGQTSMVDRMFQRRGLFENQFGRHPHMGFWSYFEEQYSRSGIWFIFPFFLLGMIGAVVAIAKRMEIGIPFFVLLLVCSVGLILYMNFADGTQYDDRTGDAYLEVRNRDYFFTPAFVFFGIAMGLGVSGVIQFIRDRLAGSNPGLQKTIVTVSSLAVLLPAVSLVHNYHACDRSENLIPYNYAANLLDSVEQDAILFTSGDNDTFPLWCIQEVYGYRKDVRVVNLSLLNTDWYVAQMKNRYGVPISLTQEQILWYPYEARPGLMAARPLKTFLDRPRQRRTYLQASPYGGRLVKVQDMMVDEIVLENKWKYPVYFSSPPYGESPLNLRDRATAAGLVYRLDREPPPRLIDPDTGYDLFMNTYRFEGYEDSEVFRDENATGVFLSYGVNGTRLYDEFIRQGDTTRAIAVLTKLIDSYPEYWQSYMLLGELHMSQGDTATFDSLLNQLKDTLESFLASNPNNLFYKQDLGMVYVEIGRMRQDSTMIEKGIDLSWEAFTDNPNSQYGFRKLITVLGNQQRYSDVRRATELHAEYKINQNDPMVRQLLGLDQVGSTPPSPGGQRGQ